MLTRFTSLAQCEAGPNLGSNVVNEVTNHLDMVTGHNQFLGRIWCADGKGECDGDIGSSDEELRTIVGHEGSVATTLIFG
jgi:hypothetical protein